MGHLLISLLKQPPSQTQELTSAQLSEGLPDEFRTYFDYCRGLTFESKPNYDYLRRLFKELYNQNRFQHDFKFEWSELNLSELPPDADDGAGTYEIEPDDCQTTLSSVEIEKALESYESEVERVVTIKAKDIPAVIEPEETPAPRKEKGCLIF